VPSLDFRQNLARFGKPIDFVLGKDELVIDQDIEDAVVSPYQDRLGPDLLLDFGRQTGGPRKVVSASAILDFDLHMAS
jgi:hypothetical protein